MNEKQVRVICAKVDVERWEEQEREMVPGSMITPCTVCDDSVWISPEGHRFAYIDNSEDAVVVCTDCHIRLEIERHRDDDNAEAVQIQAVPRSGVPMGAVWGYQRILNKLIKEGMEDGTDGA